MCNTPTTVPIIGIGRKLAIVLCNHRPRIVGVMVSMLTSSMVVHGFEHGQVKPKTICSFSAKHDILRSKSKGCLAQNLGASE
jgi:hypothetical protein